MPRINIYERQITAKPVGKAPLPLAGAQTGEEAIGAGMQAVGGGIENIGNVVFQIKQEQIALQDSINETKADALIKSEQDDFSNYIATNDLIINPDGVSNWQEESIRSMEQLRKSILDSDELKFSNKAHVRMSASLQALAGLRESGLRLKQTETLQKNNQTALPLAIERAYASGNQLLIDKAVRRFEENRERIWGSEQARADIELEEAIVKGHKEFLINASKLNPEEIIQQITEDKSNLTSGGKDKYGLDAKDYDDIIASAYTAINLREKNLEAGYEKARDEISEAIKTNNPDTPTVIQNSLLKETEQWTWYDRWKNEANRIAQGKNIITDEARKHELLDMVAAINWPERNVTPREVRERAYEGRYGLNPYLDDTAYDQVRDAIRSAEEDKIPFTEKHIEQVIGELITGAPSSVLGLPLPTLRTRDDAIKHATNNFGRFVDRIPGVMDTINAKYPPEKTKSTINELKGNPAYDFDGELIGEYNPDGSITLNAEGVKRLFQIAGNDINKARNIAENNRYVIPRNE